MGIRSSGLSAGQAASGGGLLKTGQTVSYHAGDDGDLEKGVAKDYTVLTIGQYSGTTNIVINGKTHALSNNCVSEGNTGLMWARYVPNADIGPAMSGKLFWDQWTLASKTDISFDAATKEIRSVAAQFNVAALCDNRRFTIAGSANNDGTFNVNGTPTTGVIIVDEAVIDEAAGASVTIATVDDLIWNFLDQANANSLGGHNDWRIPNHFELTSILNLGIYNPCIDTTTFPSTPSSYHWTSTAYPSNSAYAFFVHFRYGYVYHYVKTTLEDYVRLVRG